MANEIAVLGDVAVTLKHFAELKEQLVWLLEET